MTQLTFQKEEKSPVATTRQLSDFITVTDPTNQRLSTDLLNFSDELLNTLSPSERDSYLEFLAESTLHNSLESSPQSVQSTDFCEVDPAPAIPNSYMLTRCLFKTFVRHFNITRPLQSPSPEILRNNIFLLHNFHANLYPDLDHVLHNFACLPTIDTRYQRHISNILRRAYTDKVDRGETINIFENFFSFFSYQELEIMSHTFDKPTRVTNTRRKRFLNLMKQPLAKNSKWRPNLDCPPPPPPTICSSTSSFGVSSNVSGGLGGVETIALEPEGIYIASSSISISSDGTEPTADLHVENLSEPSFTPFLLENTSHLQGLIPLKLVKGIHNFSPYDLGPGREAILQLVTIKTFETLGYKLVASEYNVDFERAPRHNGDLLFLRHGVLVALETKMYQLGLASQVVKYTSYIQEYYPNHVVLGLGLTPKSFCVHATNHPFVVDTLIHAVTMTNFCMYEISTFMSYLPSKERCRAFYYLIDRVSDIISNSLNMDDFFAATRYSPGTNSNSIDSVQPLFMNISSADSMPSLSEASTPYIQWAEDGTEDFSTMSTITH